MPKNLLTFLFAESQFNAALDADLEGILEAAAMAEKLEVSCKPLDGVLKQAKLSGKANVEIDPSGYTLLVYDDAVAYSDDLLKLEAFGPELAQAGWVVTNGGSTESDGEYKIKLLCLDIIEPSEGDGDEEINKAIEAAATDPEAGADAAPKPVKKLSKAVSKLTQ